MKFDSSALQPQLDLVCIRHGRSGFNQGEIDFFSKNPHLKYPEAEEDQQFREEVLFSEKFIDTHLSAEGVRQCHQAKRDPSLDKVSLVMVSPLNRALQTANIIFADRQVPVIVHPKLAESFRYSCDLSHPLQTKKAEFSHFDFSLLEGFGAHWQIETNLGHNNTSVLKKLMESVSQHSLAQQQKSICSQVNARQLYESNEQLRARMQKMRVELMNYRQKFQKIAVVAHLWSLRYLLSTQYDHNSYPLNMLQISNARPFWTSLARLLRR